MLFTQIEFIIFFVVTVCLLFFLRNRRGQILFLVSASYYFYAYWDYRFVILLVIPTITDFYIGKYLDKLQKTSSRKILLAISITINLSILIYFKYANWFLSSFQSLPFFSKSDILTLKTILPLGISFYTFRVLTYTIDIYRRSLKPCSNIFDFALYISFFPVLIAGPITRASYFLPQLKVFSISWENIYSGLRIFIIGIFLKLFIADRLAAFVNFFYENYRAFDTSTSWLAVLAYSVQIYCDFAGYSSMAIGIAKMLGFNIEDNFNFPYLATDIRDFWKRWHITLSAWIRDYVYIPLGGNRGGQLRTYLNLLTAMTVCGLWHGSSWTFVFWGFIHGLALIIYQIWSKMNITNTSKVKSDYSLLSWSLTFFFVTISWVFFRSDNFVQAISILRQLVVFKDGIVWHQPIVVFILIATLLIHILNVLKVKAIELQLTEPYTLTVLFCLVWLVAVFYPKEFQPFVYAQF